MKKQIFSIFSVALLFGLITTFSALSQVQAPISGQVVKSDGTDWSNVTDRMVDCNGTMIAFDVAGNFSGDCTPDPSGNIKVCATVTDAQGTVWTGCTMVTAGSSVTLVLSPAP